MTARRVAPLAAALAAAAALGGCDADDDGGEPAGDSTGPTEVRTTKVEVVEGIGRRGGFDPTALYDRLSPGVVTVLSIFGDDSLDSLLEDDGEGGQGSGFVVSGDGHVATNAHVVTTGGSSAGGDPPSGGKPPDTKRAREVYVELSDGNRVRARIVGDDPNADVALLKIDPSGLKLTPLRLGRSRSLRVGAPVAAIGSPFGERQSLSVGVISALDRSIESLTQFQIGNAIQTDAAINPGNSGGPLLSAGGAVLGINSQIRSRSGGGEGVGYAVPVDTVRRSLRELREDGEVDYGYLGVTSQQLYPQLARRLDLPVRSGALIVQVQDDSPAEKAGLRAGGDKIEFQGQKDLPTESDVVVAVDGRRLTRTRDLADLVSTHSAGDEIELQILRDGKRRSVAVKLGERPERAPDSG